MTIRELRIKAGLTQSELAELVGCSQPMIALYESGRRTPRMRLAMKIASVLGIERGKMGMLIGDDLIGKKRQAQEKRP